jgi:hypothetical protein
MSGNLQEENNIQYHIDFSFSKKEVGLVIGALEHYKEVAEMEAAYSGDLEHLNTADIIDNIISMITFSVSEQELISGV